MKVEFSLWWTLKTTRYVLVSVLICFALLLLFNARFEIRFIWIRWVWLTWTAVLPPISNFQSLSDSLDFPATPSTFSSSIHKRRHLFVHRCISSFNFIVQFHRLFSPENFIRQLLDIDSRDPSSWLIQVARYQFTDWFRHPFQFSGAINQLLNVRFRSIFNRYNESK